MRKAIGIDTETTGIEQSKGHRIIEISIIEHDLVDGTTGEIWTQRINPQRPIDPGASAVHHIHDADLVGCPTWDEVAPQIATRIANADLMVAHNMAFDGPFIVLEMARIGMACPDIVPFCTMENGRWATETGKKPKLGELCWALGVEYDPAAAHAAEYDVLKMLDCLHRGMKRGFFKLPIPVAA